MLENTPLLQERVPKVKEISFIVQKIVMILDNLHLTTWDSGCYCIPCSELTENTGCGQQKNHMLLQTICIQMIT